MKSIAEQIHDYDRENMRRVAYGMPEIQDEQPRAEVEKTAGLFNALFTQLKATFPAVMATIRTQEDLDEFRRQWLLAFGENGIVSIAQVNAGMRIARRQEKPFMPSPGQFVAWCKSEESAALGLPDVNELVDLVYQYSRTRSQYPDAESYPWPGKNGAEHTTKSKSCYWLVTTLYQLMRSVGLSDGQLRVRAGEELAKIIKRIRGGEELPEPVVRIPLMGNKPLTREQNMARVQEIRAKFGLKGGRG